MVYIKEIPAMKLELVENWRSLHKAYSMRAAAVLTTLLSVQQGVQQITGSEFAMMLAPVKALTASPTYNAVMLVLGVAIMALRTINQGLAE